MKTIEIIRGDTNKFSFIRKDAEGETIPQQADAIYFTVKESWTTQEYLIQKTLLDMTFTDGKYEFTIEPEETDNLEYGTYVYDLEVIQEGYKQTISRGTFKITEEATFATNEVE